MESHLKRMIQITEFEKLESNPGYATKKQKIEEKATAKVDGDDKEENDCQHQLRPVEPESDHGGVEKSALKKITALSRLELNRQRARDMRKRKKGMIENMQKQLILLKAENDKLRKDNQMQLEEITLLRNAAKLLISGNRPLTHTIAPPTRLGNSDIFNITSGIGGTNDRISELLQELRQSRNIGNNDSFLHSSRIGSTNDHISNILREPRRSENICGNAAFLQSSALSSPIIGGHQTFQNRTHPFGI